MSYGGKESLTYWTKTWVSYKENILWNETETPHLTQLCDFNKTKTCACILCFLYAIYFGFLGLTRLLTNYRTSTRGSGVMICDDLLMSFDLDLFKPNHGNTMACSMLCVVYWLLLLFSFLVWSWGIYLWDTWLNHFWVINQLYLDYFLVALMGLKCLCWSWWCHVVTCLTWPFWQSLISIILGYFPVACWEPKCIVIYFELFFSCSMRNNGYCDLSLMPLVARWELLRLLWLPFDAFYLLVEN